MSDPYMGEIRMFAGTFAPQGWEFCRGQLLSIAQNDVSKKFAGWAAIIAVPTMIAGIYGMNFKFMPELNWIYGYPLALVLTLGSSGVLYLLFKRSGWL